MALPWVAPCSGYRKRKARPDLGNTCACLVSTSESPLRSGVLFKGEPLGSFCFGSAKLTLPSPGPKVRTGPSIKPSHIFGLVCSEGCTWLGGWFATSVSKADPGHNILRFSCPWSHRSVSDLAFAFGANTWTQQKSSPPAARQVARDRNCLLTSTALRNYLRLRVTA